MLRLRITCYPILVGVRTAPLNVDTGYLLLVGRYKNKKPASSPPLKGGAKKKKKERKEKLEEKNERRIMTS